MPFHYSAFGIGELPPHVVGGVLYVDEDGNLAWLDPGDPGQVLQMHDDDPDLPRWGVGFPEAPVEGSLPLAGNLNAYADFRGTQTGQVIQWQVGGDGGPSLWVVGLWLPSSAGNAGEVLTSLGAGVQAAWQSPAQLTLSSKSTNYTLVLGDAGKLIYGSSGATRTITIPTNANEAFAIGARVYVQRGSGVLNIAGDIGVATVGPTSLDKVGEIVQLTKVGTDAWHINLMPSGNVLYAVGNLSELASPATAFANIKQAATTAATGVVELATTAETKTGTDTDRAVTPAGAAGTYLPIVTAFNSQNDNYQLVAGDAGKLVYMSNPTAKGITVPENATVAYDVGTRVFVMRGSAAVSIAGAGAVVIVGVNSLDKVGELAVLTKVGTDAWHCNIQPSGNVAYAASPTPDIQVFTNTAGGTWTKPTAPSGCTSYKTVQVFAIAGGCGGGSGRKGASSSARSGGGGGSSGSRTEAVIPIALTGATEAVAVGVGGAGGASVSAASTGGNAGSAGGDSTFGTLVAAKNSGGGGAAGSATTGAGGAQNTTSSASTDVARNGSTSANAGTGAAAGAATPAGVGGSALVGGGGGGGGASTAANVLVAGAAGADQRICALTGGAGGSDAAGTAGAPNTGNYHGGSGGGGGGGSNTVRRDGGDGGIYGAGGGGGGNGTDTVHDSGKGGDGAQGIVVVITR